MGKLEKISPEQSQAPYRAGNIQHGISKYEGKRQVSEKEKNKENNQKKFDLQERLIDYAVRIIHVSEQLPDTKAGKHVSSQILKSGTSPAPNYGEGQSAETI